MDLDPIIEDDLPQLTIVDPPSQKRILAKHTEEIASALRVQDTDDDGEVLFDGMAADSTGEEEFDMDVSSSDDASDSALKSNPLDLGDEDDSDLDVIPGPGYWQQPRSVVPAPVKLKVQGKPSKRPIHHLSAAYDCDTCCKSQLSFRHHYASQNYHTAFVIQCATRQPDGSNSPFEISSATSFDDLRNLVSEKLGRFPGLLRLCYRLDSDKVKSGATSIQTEMEFKIFKDRMRNLIVPPVLSNGKKSTRPMKKVVVCFEDGSTTDQQSTNPVTGNKSVWI